MYIHLIISSTDTCISHTQHSRTHIHKHTHTHTLTPSPGIERWDSVFGACSVYNSPGWCRVVWPCHIPSRPGRGERRECEHVGWRPGAASSGSGHSPVWIVCINSLLYTYIHVHTCMWSNGNWTGIGKNVKSDPWIHTHTSFCRHTHTHTLPPSNTHHFA